MNRLAYNVLFVKEYLQQQGPLTTQDRSDANAPLPEVFIIHMPYPDNASIAVLNKIFKSFDKEISST